MTHTCKVIGVAAALSILLISSATVAYAGPGEDAEETRGHMGKYAAEINHLLATTKGIVANYKPGRGYADDLKALIAQWESLSFHHTLETSRALALYPPIWAAIGAFSTAIKEGVPAATVQAKADGIAAALWQGYGALKLLLVLEGADGTHEPAHKHNRASGDSVIDTINIRLAQVLAAYKDSHREKALELTHDTYMGYFEGIEGDLIEQDAELVSGLEMDFNATLPNLIKNNAPVAKVADQIDDMKDDLEGARKLLKAAEQEESQVF